MLPPNIRTELFYEMNTFFFKFFPWTQRFSDQFISALSFEIEEIMMLENTILHEVGKIRIGRFKNFGVWVTIDFSFCESLLLSKVKTT